MSEKLAFEIYYIELWHILSVIFIIIVNSYIYFKATKNSLLYSYLSVQALLFIWLVSKIFKTVSPNENIRWFFIVTQYFGNCFLGSTLFAFAYTYAKGKIPNKKTLIFTSLPSAFFFVAMATNPLHMLFYSYYDFNRDSFGPLFYLNQVYSYSIMLIGIIICAKQFFIEFHNKRVQAAIISFAVIIPLIANIFYVLKLFKPIFGFRPLFDITPITCNISLFLFVIGTFRYKFFDISSIAWRKVFNQVPEGIILYNNTGNITDINNTAFATSETDEIVKAALEKSLNNESAEFLHKTLKDKWFKVLISPYFQKDRKRGHIIRFIDDTYYEQSLKDLSDKNQVLLNINKILISKANMKQNLAVYKTRNHIGREVHDILGHSIVLALSILEVARLSLKQDLDAAKEKFLQSIVVLRSAKEQLDNTLLKSIEKNETQKISFLASITKLIEDASFEDRDINLTVQGSVQELSKNLSEGIFRLCQESLTNAIRHGKAEKIDIILRFYSTKLEVYVIDNGIGCLEIKKGYGLTGMEKRIISNLKGALNFGSFEGGFTVSAIVPFNTD